MDENSVSVVYNSMSSQNTLLKGVFNIAIIPQQSLFVWNENENLGDLERLRLVLDYIPDEKLMEVLVKERGNGSDDYPIRTMWNSIFAGAVFVHISIDSLRRELSRNGQLRHMYGFRSGKEVPKSYIYSRLSNYCSKRMKWLTIYLIR